MLTSEFDFALPDHLIAQHPAPRGTSRLLVLGAGDSLEHTSIAELPRLLRPGDLLVVNDTRVIPARLFARRAGSGGRVELLLVERLDGLTWSCLARPGRKAKPEAVLELSEGLSATVVGKEADGRHRVRFSEPIEPHLDALGAVPLPPYIKRPADSEDRHDYQTIFAAAP